jgi:hypothetical protein
MSNAAKKPRSDPRLGSEIDSVAHLHGALALAGLARFFVSECYGHGLMEALSHQSEYGISGLAVLTALGVYYLYGLILSIWTFFRGHR